MSFHHQNVKAFIRLLETQSSLLSNQDKVDLNRLGDTLPKEIEPISNIISAWYQDRPEILDAQLAILAPMYRGETTKEKGPGDTPLAEISPEEEKKLRELLENEIRRVCDNASSQESKPDKDPTQSSR
jgi:hypothetical protein